MKTWLSVGTLGRFRPSVLFFSCLIPAMWIPSAWAGGKTHVVKIEEMKFTPESITVQKGDTITWENHDLVPHTVTSVAGQRDKIESGTIESGKSFTVKAPRSRNFSYYCRFHPLMKGAIHIAQEKL